jgi:hypothetical protein
VGLARFVGLDVSAPAIRYAKRVGLLDEGIVADLERGTLPQDAARVVGDVDVILSTGAVGYVTDKTFRALLGAMPSAPWIISFVLRMFPYESFAALFAEHGLVTERFAGALFVQRRFRDIAEFESGLERLASRGVRTDGFESDGLLRAELFLSRPAGDVEAARLDDIVTVCSGRNRTIGTRYVKVKARRQQVALES